MQVLLTNPEIDELTYYLSAWTNQMLKNCKQKHKFYHLKRNKITRNRFNKILNKRSIDLILLCGHKVPKVLEKSLSIMELMLT